jgi:phage-related tail fiber protein
MVTKMRVTGVEFPGMLMPIGAIIAYAGSTLPDGWVWCDGSAISRTDYATLYASVGTSFGVGDGSTTFNVPDLRGRVLVGKDNMGASAASRVTTSTEGLDGAALAATGQRIVELDGASDHGIVFNFIIRAATTD